MYTETHSLVRQAKKDFIRVGESVYDGFEIAIKPNSAVPLIATDERFYIGEDGNDTPIYTGLNVLLMDQDIHAIVSPFIAPFTLRPYDSQRLFFPGPRKKLIVPVSYPLSHMRKTLPINYAIEGLNEIRIKFEHSEVSPYYYFWVTEIDFNFIEREGGLLEELQRGRFTTGAKFNIAHPDSPTPFQIVSGGELTNVQILEAPCTIKRTPGLSIMGINGLSGYQDDIAALANFRP